MTNTEKLLEKIIESKLPMTVNLHPTDYIKVGFEFTCGVILAITVGWLIGSAVLFLVGLL